MTSGNPRLTLLLGRAQSGHQDWKSFVLCAVCPSFLQSEPHISVLSAGCPWDCIHRIEALLGPSRASMDFWIKAYYILLTKIKRPSPSMCAWHQSGGCKGLNWVMEMNSETTGYFSTDSSGRDPTMIRIPSCKTCRTKLEMVNAFQATSREIRGHSLKSKEAVEGHTIHLLQSIGSVVSRGRGDGHPEGAAWGWSSAYHPTTWAYRIP